MAGLKSSNLDAEKSNILDLAGRRIILFGSAPNAQKIVAGLKRKEVYPVTSISEFNERSALARDPDNNTTGYRIHTIIILAYPGDDISDIPEIYKIAVELNVLVTTIIVHKSCCMPMSNFKSLAGLRASTDMLVITSDENYLEYMLDCLL